MKSAAITLGVLKGQTERKTQNNAARFRESFYRLNRCQQGSPNCQFLWHHKINCCMVRVYVCGCVVGFHILCHILFSLLFLYTLGPVTFTCPPVFPISFAFKFLLLASCKNSTFPKFARLWKVTDSWFPHVEKVSDPCKPSQKGQHIFLNARKH